MESSFSIGVRLHQLLESSNLLPYESSLLDQGADDVDQLVELTPEEFQQLCAMIGMDKKPFHVMRLKKALEKYSEHSKSTPTTDTPQSIVSNSSVVCNSITTSSCATIPSTPPLKAMRPASITPPTDTVVPSPLIRTQTSTLTSQSSPLTQTSTSGSTNHLMGNEDSLKFFLPAYLHPNADSTDFSPLVDFQTAVQATLEPPPFKPAMWDDKRKSIVQKYSALYGQSIEMQQNEPLSPFEQHIYRINAAAYQLCLRDPTLLVRRDELFLLAKRAVKESGQTDSQMESPDISPVVTHPSIGQKRSWEIMSTASSLTDTQSVMTTPLASSSSSNLTHLNTNQRLSTKERVNKMHLLHGEIEANKERQRGKIAAMEEAKRVGNFSTAFNLQLEVESLGNECQELEGVYTLLKRKQARSNRYFRDKTKQQAKDYDDTTAGKLEGEFKHNKSTLLSPIQTVPPIEMVTDAKIVSDLSKALELATLPITTSNESHTSTTEKETNSSNTLTQTASSESNGIKITVMSGTSPVSNEDSGSVGDHMSSLATENTFGKKLKW